MKRLDIVYGLSNSGKTTLCKNITDALYINIGEDIDFRKKTMIEIVKKNYDSKNDKNYYITEACLIDYSYRNKFAKELNDYIKPDIINFFYLEVSKDDLIIMASKSKTKELTYNRYLNDLTNIKLGVELGNHYVIKTKNLKERINFIKSL